MGTIGDVSTIRTEPTHTSTPSHNQEELDLLVQELNLPYNGNIIDKINSISLEDQEDDNEEYTTASTSSERLSPSQTSSTSWATTSPSASRRGSIDPIQALQYLQSRLPTELAEMVSALGKLYLVDTLTIRRKRQDSVTLYLFDDAVLFVKPKRKLIGKSSRALELVGRIFIKDIKRVYDSSIAQEIALTIELKQDACQVLFDAAFTLEMWKASLESIMQNHSNNGPSTPISSRPLSLITDISSEESSWGSLNTPISMTRMTSSESYISKGEETSIVGLATYVASEPTQQAKRKGRVAILVIGDVLGWRWPTLRRIADELAHQGFLSFIPDVFKGDAIELDQPDALLKADEFFNKHSFDAVSERINLVIDALRFGVKATKVVVLGYGYGAQFAMYANATDQCDVSVAVTPTSLGFNEGYFQRMEKPIQVVLSPETASAPWVRRLEYKVSKNNRRARFITFPNTSRRFAQYPTCSDDQTGAVEAFEDCVRYIERHV